MAFNLPDFDTIERKDIGETHELLKLREKERGLFTLILSPKDSNGGAIFCGHNWEEIGQHPAMIDKFYEQINSQADFAAISYWFRKELQALIEKGKI